MHRALKLGGAFAVAICFGATSAGCEQRREPVVKAPPAAPAAASEANLGVALGPAATWSCKDGRKLTLQFFKDPEYVLILRQDGAQLSLGQSETLGQNGATRYDSEVRSLEVKGATAKWKDDDGPETTCAKSAAG